MGHFLFFIYQEIKTRKSENTLKQEDQNGNENKKTRKEMKKKKKRKQENQNGNEMKTTRKTERKLKPVNQKDHKERLTR